MTEEEAKQLLVRYHSGECTDAENALVDRWLSEFSNEPVDLTSERIAEIKAEVFELLPKPLKVSKTRKLYSWPRIATAAAVALIIFTAGLFYYFNVFHQSFSEHQYANDVKPGKKGATLTLANGKKIRLTDAANGRLAKEAGVSISKTANGEILYEIGETSDANKINTLSTAKGETYILTLPDKSKVWMNAASSLTYSATLNDGGIRKVKLDGEAYFEVTKDAAHPFIVESNGQKVTVLGTHFNINSYQNENAVKTTLLEGSVRVSPSASIANDAIIKPDQQAVLTGGSIRVKEVNVEEAVSWKDGYFVFDTTPLEVVMRQVERWYDVEVVYERPEVRTRILGGSISRYNNVSRILKTIENTGAVRFEVTGRKIIVK